jgi:hypothetical protein
VCCMLYNLKSHLHHNVVGHVNQTGIIVNRGTCNYEMINTHTLQRKHQVTLEIRIAHFVAAS